MASTLAITEWTHRSKGKLIPMPKHIQSFREAHGERARHTGSETGTDPAEGVLPWTLDSVCLGCPREERLPNQSKGT